MRYRSRSRAWKILLVGLEEGDYWLNLQFHDSAYGFEIEQAMSAFEAGSKVATPDHRPDCVVIKFAENYAAKTMAQSIWDKNWGKKVLLIGLHYETQEVHPFRQIFHPNMHPDTLLQFVHDALASSN